MAVALTARANSQPRWLRDAIANSDSLSLDTEAPALVIAHEATLVFKKNGSAERKVRRAVKILGPKGDISAILTETVSERRTLKGLKGWRIESDGRSHKLEKENIIEIADIGSVGYYSDARVVTAGFPRVNKGDVVGFEYTLKYDRGLDGLCQAFVFQEDLPVVAAKLTVTLPNNWQLCHSSQNLEPVSATVAKNSYVWESGFLPYRPVEPLMPPMWRVSRHILVSGFPPDEPGKFPVGNWDDVARWEWSLRDDTNEPSSEVESLTSDLCEQVSVLTDKLAAISKFVQDDIRYVAMEIDFGRFEPRPPATTLVNRFGDCKDKVRLMRAMIEQVGINSLPVLAAVGQDVDTTFPSTCLFNHVILAIDLNQLPGFDTTCEACSDGWLYFDPTDPFTEPGHLPRGLCGSWVLRFSVAGGELVKLPSVNPEKNRRVNSAIATLDSNYNLTAQVRQLDFGQSRTRAVRYRQSLTQKELHEEILGRYASSLSNVRIDELEHGYSTDSAWISFVLSSDSYIVEIGDLRLLRTNFFQSNRSEKLKKNAERKYDIWFGHPKSYETRIDWYLPPGWAIDGEVETVTAHNEIASVVGMVELVDSTVRYQNKITILGGTFDVSAYRQARAFQSSMRAATGLQIPLTVSQGGNSESSR